MNEQEYINYIRIAEAIEYINQNYAEQPTLEEIAKKVHLSPFHFQKMCIRFLYAIDKVNEIV